MSYFYIALFLIITLFLFIELNHRNKASSPLQINAEDWKVDLKDKELVLNGKIRIFNPHPTIEVMVPELEINPVVLSNGITSGLKKKISIKPNHLDQESRDDEYWQAYIIKAKKSTEVNVNISIKSIEKDSNTKDIENIWVNIFWVNYGPFGRMGFQNGFVVPVKIPSKAENSKWIKLSNDIEVLPIKTHVLGSLDKSMHLLSNYTKGIIKPGDILTIGETPLAIIQGRYTHPANLEIEFISKLLCRAFKPTSSLATACGLQVLIDEVGPSRVLVAWILGAASSILNIKGSFYRFAGKQARLIDDITGTTPPYDQTIVLGPIKAQEFCNSAAESLGIEIAVVDVNDLGRVKIVASSSNCNNSILKRALSSNPAGNADEQTPIVLVRPS